MLQMCSIPSSYYVYTLVISHSLKVSRAKIFDRFLCGLRNFILKDFDSSSQLFG